MVTRGIKHDVDRFINDMQAMYLPYKVPKGKVKGNYHVQLAMRPVQLWEVVFPEPALQTVLNTIWYEQQNERKAFKMPFGMMRKALKLEKVPAIDSKIPGRIVYKNNVSAYAIGVKKDVTNIEDGHEEL